MTEQQKPQEQKPQDGKTPDQIQKEEDLKRKIEELRKRDPFIYR